MQFNTWVSCDASHVSLPVVRSPRITGEQVYLEDLQTDEDKINSSLLSSESTFLPLASDLEPQTPHTDSEDETETFEPDSLAPKRPSQSRNPNPEKTNASPLTDKHQKKTQAENVLTGAAVASPAVVAMQENNSEMLFDFGNAESRDAAKQGEATAPVCKLNLLEAEKAAIKIQSWWRGHYTRCFHPAAREVRSEIRLRRMQEHIVFLSDQLET